MNHDFFLFFLCQYLVVLQDIIYYGTSHCFKFFFVIHDLQLNKWTPPVPSSQVRSLRKVNNDQVSIAIDTDAGSSGRIEDEEDDKGSNLSVFCSSSSLKRIRLPITIAEHI